MAEIKTDLGLGHSRPVHDGVRPVKRFASIAAVFFAALAMPSAYAIEQGSAAPSFEIPGQSGSVNLSAYRGKLVYLDFWASWCGPCKRSFPWMRELQTRFGSQGFQVVAVNLDAKHSDALDFLAAVPANFVIGFDPAGTVAHSYGVKGMPSSMLITPDGKVIAVHQGFNDADKAELESLVMKQLKHGD